MNKLRDLLYKTARIIGDVQAVKRNRVPKRVVRRVAGKATGKLLRKLFK